MADDLSFRITADFADAAAAFAEGSLSVDEFKRKLEELNNSEANPKLKADASELAAKLIQGKADLDDLDARTATPAVNLDILQEELKRDQVIAHLEELSSKTATPKVIAEIAAAEADLVLIEERLQALNEEHARPKVEAEVTGEAQLAALKAEIDSFRDKHIRIDADASSVTTEVQKATAEVKKLDDAGKSSNSTATAMGAVWALAGAAVAAAWGPAGAALAMIPAAAFAAAGALGTVVSSFTGVGEAIKNVDAAQKAQLGTAAQQAAANQKLAESMSELAPAAQRFVLQLNQMAPAFKAVQFEAQTGLFPGLEQSLKNIQPLLPTIAQGFQQTGQVLGQLAAQGTAMMASGPWRADFAQIMASNNRALTSWGQAALSILDVLRNLASAAGPVTERFAAFEQQLTSTWAAELAGARASGELGQWFQQMGDALASIGHVLAQVATGFTQLAGALAPLGGLTLQLVGDLAQLIGNFAQANPTITQAAAVIAAVGFAIGPVVNALKTLGTAWTTVQTALNAAGLALGVFTEKLAATVVSEGAAATAGTAVAASFAAVATGLAGGLVVGLVAADAIWSKFTTSVDDAAAAMIKGGTSAQQMTQQIQSQLTPFGEWLANLTGLAATMQNTTQRVNEMKAAMDPLTLAETNATQAGNDYLAVANQFGSSSQEAASASQAYQAALAQVTNQQNLLKAATDGTTASLNTQLTAILGLVNADVAFGNSLAAFATSLQNNGKSFDINTAAGRNNISMLTAMVAAAQAADAADVKAGASVQQQTANHNARVATLQKEASQNGVLSGTVQTLINDYAKVTPGITTATTATQGQTTAVQGLGGAIQGLPTAHDTKITADAANLIAGVNTAATAVGQIPKLSDTKLTADPSGIVAGAGQAATAVQAIPQSWLSRLLGDAANLLGVIGAAKVGIGGVPATHSTTFTGDPSNLAAGASTATTHTQSVPASHDTSFLGNASDLLNKANSGAQGILSVEKNWITQFLGEASNLLGVIGAANLGIGGVPTTHGPTAFTGDASNITASAGQAGTAIKGVPVPTPSVFTADVSNLVAGAGTASTSIGAVPSTHPTTITGDPSNLVAGAGTASTSIAGIPTDHSTAINATDNATSVINSIISAMNSLQDKTVTITTVYRTVQAAGGLIATPGGVTPMASGGNLSPNMSGSVARVVPPNTWRVIGDRMTDDEAFIPINNSSASKAILSETANRMGHALTPMADGGYNQAGDWLQRLLGNYYHGGGGGTPTPPPVLKQSSVPLYERFSHLATRNIGFGAGNTVAVTSSVQGYRRTGQYSTGNIELPPVAGGGGSGGSGPPVHVHCHFDGDGLDDLGRSVMTFLRKGIRVQGGNVQSVLGN